MKWSHKFKVTKKDVHLCYDDLAYDEDNITEPRRKRKQKLLNSYSKLRKKTTPISLNWIRAIL